MTQALYAHMNNKTIKIKKQTKKRKNTLWLVPMTTTAGDCEDT
jgi:hypothetical protein